MADKITNNTAVSTSELACVLGITGRRVRQLAEDGVLDKISEGKFNLCDAVKKFMNNSAKTKETSEQDEAKLKAEVSIKKAKAIKAVMEANELQGKMHRSEDVAAMTADLIYAVRGALIALPGRLAMDASAAETPAEAAEIIRKEVYKIMNELAAYKYDPKKYEERVRERMDWDSLASDDDDE